ncbi:MAG: nucleotide sugar dehydrogenase [Desulfobacteria bacterium]
MVLKSDNIKSPGNSEIAKPIIGFAGLTHLGLNTAVASAAHGFQVVGYHDDSALVAQLNSGKPHILELGLPELLKEHQERINFSTDSKSLVHCNIVYIAVDVPTDDQGASDLAPIHRMLKTATAAMRPDALLVILCQVPPGFTRQIEWPAEQLYYQVETLIFGRAVERAMYPERFILGCANPAQTLNAKLYNYLKAFDCPILPMRYESAELAKISINMCLVAAVSTANTLAEICEHIGADWSEIVPALRLDKRIGQYSYLTPGLGISGGNLERDLATILRYAEKHNTDGGVVAAWVKNSRHRKDWAWDTFKKLGLENKLSERIAVLGLTYKENTHSIKNSPALVFLAHLTDRKVVAFDPAAPLEATGPNVSRTTTAIEALKGADVLAIMTPWQEFSLITTELLLQNMAGRIVIDPYRMLDGTALKAQGFIYATLGAPVKE